MDARDYKPGNPFAERAIAARRKADALNTPTAHEKAMANAFPLGAGFGHGSQRSRNKKIDASVSRAHAAIEAEKRARYLEAQATAFDHGEVNAQGRSVKTEAEIWADAQLNRGILASVKVGDSIDVGGNAPLKVVKVNAKSVVTDGGSKWAAGEIARVIPAAATAAVRP